MTHPDPDVLAEFRAGLGTGRRRARIASHLTACERCTGLSDQLGEVSALLAAVPAPAMPDAVAQRLESVLAAQAAQRDSSERAIGDSADHRAQHRPRHRARGPRPDRHWDFRLVALRVLAPVAAVVVLAAGGYGLSRIAGGSTSSVAAGSEAASAASPARAGAAAAAPSSAASSRPEAAPLEPAARFGVVTSATNYQRATLPQQLQHELQRYARPAAGNEQSVQELAPGPVKECVLRVTAGISPVSLVLVEKAYYQGQPANVIVAARGDHDTAWVTTPACSAGSDYVLDRTTLPGTSAS